MEIEVRCWKCNILIKKVSWLKYIFMSNLLNECERCKEYDRALWEVHKKRRYSNFIRAREKYLKSAKHNSK